MFDTVTVAAVGGIAARLRVEPAILLAIAEIESAGVTGAKVGGRMEPVIRWEGHYFDARLKNGRQAGARRAGLASPRAGKIANPSKQAERWSKLYLPGSKIDAVAAFESTSWGLGQVMGAHWRKLGFASAAEMFAMARAGAAGQIEIMARYIEQFGLADELQRRDFRAFTRGYNGPGGIKAGYHRAMAAAYQRRSGSPAVSAAAGMLRMGSAGALVRELQALLVRAGYAIKVDGDYGPSTRDAVREFQRTHGLEADGVAGPQTQRALSALRVAPEEQPGAQAVSDVAEVRQGAGVAGVAVAIDAAQQQIGVAVDKLGGIASFGWISTGLTTVAGVLAVAGLAYAAWGWIRSRRTETGDEDAPATAAAASPEDAGRELAAA